MAVEAPPTSLRGFDELEDHRERGAGRALHFAIVAVLVAFCGQQFVQFTARFERSLVGVGILAAIGFGIACFRR